MANLVDQEPRRSSYDSGTETLLRLLPHGERPSLAVFTSGGDSQGMNPAIRATVRMAIYCGFRVYLIYEGYEGMIEDGEEGKELIREATWGMVSNIMQLGGTIIGSARSSRFRTREGRLLAARNLVRRGINSLVVIGGDGSLTGADVFRREWPSLLDELVRDGAITAKQRSDYGQLHIAGMVGSIDNDFCGTDMTIGTDSALHRIIEACDALVTTAESHQRAFVMEVMGRHCGYLALVSALCCEADFLFIPEEPPGPDWPELMCNYLMKARQHGGKRLNIVIVAEGAIDTDGRPISANAVRDAIVDRLKYDTRVTVLGHVQRGGAPSAFDRLLGCRMAAEAVLALVDARADPGTPSTVVSLEANQAVRLPLMECVQRTKAVNEAIKDKDYARSVELRGKSFQNNLITYQTLKKLHSPANHQQPQKPQGGASTSPALLIVMVGAPACGANACIRAFVRTGISNGFRVLGVSGGFEGLARGNWRDLSWESVTGLTATGGSFLGTKRTTAAEIGLDKVFESLAKVPRLSGVLIIGGFEAYSSLVQLNEARGTYPDMAGLPILLAPCTISNNVPGTDFSIGADTALNEITQIIDKLKQSAVGTQRRVFVVETMGGNCGYLATLAGLAGGADAAYVTEDKFDLSVLLEDVRHLKNKMSAGTAAQQLGLILRNENANENYSTEFVYRVFKEEGKGVFDCRYNVLGHMQQGGTPSPYDRNLGTKFGVKCADWFLRRLNGPADDPSRAVGAGVVGITKRGTTVRPLVELLPLTDFKQRMLRADTQWWLRLRPLLRILAKHQSVYESDSVPRTLSEHNFATEEPVGVVV